MNLQKVCYENKSVLRNLIELYKYDFSEYVGKDVNEHGLYEYKFVDHYWSENGRHPYFIRVGEKLAGFALVREHGVNDSKQTIYSMAEFFIMRKYRRTGVGSDAARSLFVLFPGEWRISQMDSNQPSQLFWRKLIGEYTNHKFEEGRREDSAGPCQRFLTTEVNR